MIADNNMLQRGRLYRNEILIHICFDFVFLTQ